METVAGGAGGLGPIDKVLELARWAPSGDNTQPWRFERVDDWRAIVHAFDTREWCVYDLDGRASQVSHGALLETVRLAASLHGLRADMSLRAGCSEARLVFDVALSPDPSVAPSALASAIKDRSAQRRPMPTTSLTAEQMRALEEAVGAGHQVVWMRGWPRRLAAALDMFHSAKLRLAMREAYEVHRDVIEWGARFSEDRLPDKSLGVSAPILWAMRVGMGSWARVRWANRFLGGTLAPRIAMDLIPSLRCGAHFALVAKRAPEGVEDYLDAGRAAQRFWLAATLLGLQVQPEITPLVFARYAREAVDFSTLPWAAKRAREIRARLAGALGEREADAAVFMGRIGSGPPACSRSVRLPLDRLWVESGFGAARAEPARRPAPPSPSGMAA